MGDFIPPSGVHDSNCEFVCRKPAPAASGFKYAHDDACKHNCKVCDKERRRQRKKREA